MSDKGVMSQYGMGYDPYAWRSNMDAQPQSPLAQLKPGPAPTGSDKVFDAVYGYLGGTPDKREQASTLSKLFNLGTMGLATGAYDGAAEMAKGHGPRDLAAMLMPGMRPAGAAAKVATTAAREAMPAAREAVQGIRGYHGSPHDFAAERLVRHPDGRTEYVVGTPDRLPDIPAGANVVKDFPLGRFREDKIGTGEGAQAYGHGVAYIAENEGVAKAYRDALSQDKAWDAVKGKKYNDDGSPNFPGMGAEWLHTGTSTDEILDNFAYFAKDSTLQQRQQWLEEAQRMSSGAKHQGRMYEVNIKANPDDFLDWDKPLSQQSEKVRGALDNVGLWGKQAVGTHGGTSGRAQTTAGGVQGVASNDGLKGSDLYNAIARRKVNGDWGDPGDFARTQATQALREAGVPGIRYLDQGSRAGGEGSRNYVAFDDSLIEILRKYGLLPPAAFGAAAAGQDPAQAQVMP